MFLKNTAYALFFAAITTAVPALALKQNILIIVDADNTFAPQKEGIAGSGELPVPGAWSIVEPINTLIKQGKFAYIVQTHDWHPENHKSFENVKGTTDAGIKFPAHGRAHTPGSESLDGLQIPNDAIIVHKGMNPDIEEFSGWNGIVQNGEHQGATMSNAIASIAKKAPSRFVVVGLATDYCVHNTAEDMHVDLGSNKNNTEKNSFYLISDACSGVNPEASDAKIANLRAKGFKVVTAQQFIEKAAKPTRSN